MAMYEIVTAGWEESGQYREIIDYLGDWVCGYRRLGGRANNPAASLEGLIHAYDLAARDGDEDRVQQYGQVIRACLERMMALQVGHPRASEFAGRAPVTAPARGGCQHWPNNPALRIDFAQHQLHAGLLASGMFPLD
jgi:hypothetical protein